MFQNLSERLSQTLKSIKGQARLTDDNIKDTLREVRKALLEADVALPVVKAFIERVRERAVGQEVSKSLSPGQQFVKIVQQELEAIMGEANEGLGLKGSPAVVLMAGGEMSVSPDGMRYSGLELALEALAEAGAPLEGRYWQGIQ